jgi:hypothetical protein
MQVGVQCPRGEMTWDACAVCRQNPLHPCMYPADVLDLMQEHYDDPDREPGSEAFTPTRLLGCDRQGVLMGRGETYVDVDRAWFPVRGNMVHALMERAPYPGALHVLREQRLHTTVDTCYGPQPFSAKPDLIVVQRLAPDGLHCKIVDYKSTNAIGHDLVQARTEHQLQTNMYAWIAARVVPDLLGVPECALVVDELEIVYADMKRVRRFTSAGWLKDRGPMLRRSPRSYTTLDLAPITIYHPDRVGAFIQRRIEERLAAREELPPVLEGDRAWMCDFCPVRTACFALAGKGDAS